MRLTTRQRREKKQKQKVRAQIRKVKGIIYTLCTNVDPMGDVAQAKELLSRALKEQLAKMRELPWMEDVRFEVDAGQQVVKMNFTMKPVPGSMPAIPFFGDEYANALKYDGGESVLRDLKEQAKKQEDAD